MNPAKNPLTVNPVLC